MPEPDGRILADVNLWLATIVEAHPHHRRALDWWRQAALRAGSKVYFCRVTQLGLLRLLTNATVMGTSVRSSPQAWEHYAALSEQRPVGFLQEPRNFERAFRELSSAHKRRSAGMWMDAYLAAFATTANAVLVTFDRGFRRFTELRLEVLE